MRDYLEELLEEQAREQEEDSPEALLPAASGPIRRRGTAGGGQAPAGRRGEETSGLQKYGGKVRPAPEEAAPGRGGTAAEPLLAELWPGERAVLGVPAVERGTPPGDREEMYRQAAENGGTENRGEERELPELWGAWDSRTVKGALPPAAVPRRFPPEDGGAWLYRELRQGAAAADYARRETGGGTWPEQPELTAGGVLTPAELDRALERDARRYDRGFTLF